MTSYQKSASLPRPVIDPATNTIYVEAKTKETVGNRVLHGFPFAISTVSNALDLSTG